MANILMSPCSPIENATDKPSPGILAYESKVGFISLHPNFDTYGEGSGNVKAEFYDLAESPSFELPDTDWACITGNGQRFWKNPDTAQSFVRQAIGELQDHVTIAR